MPPAPDDLTAVAAMPATSTAPRPLTRGHKVSAALARKMAQMATFAPATVPDALDSPGSFAEQDWLEHNTDGAGNGPAPFTAFATARNDWFGLRRRGRHGHG